MAPIKAVTALFIHPKTDDDLYMSEVIDAVIWMWNVIVDLKVDIFFFKPEKIYFVVVVLILFESCYQKKKKTFFFFGGILLNVIVMRYQICNTIPNL